MRTAVFAIKSLSINPRAMAAAILATLALVVFPLAGCSGTDNPTARETERTTTTMAAPTVRTDAEPITRRFPALAEYQDLHWTGEAAGTEDSRVPGPTDVHIRAIVVLTPEAAQRTAVDYPWTPVPTQWESDVQDPLRGHLPVQGTWQSNDTYTHDLLGSSFGGTVYFNPTTGTVYLDVFGR